MIETEEEARTIRIALTEKAVSRQRAYNRARMRKLNGYPEPTRPVPEACECCGEPPGNRSLSLDHCHVTGKFRGWLCGKCNMAIGLLGDNIQSVTKAIDYLKKAE